MQLTAGIIADFESAGQTHQNHRACTISGPPILRDWWNFVLPSSQAATGDVLVGAAIYINVANYRPSAFEPHRIQ